MPAKATKPRGRNTRTSKKEPPEPSNKPPANSKGKFRGRDPGLAPCSELCAYHRLNCGHIMVTAQAVPCGQNCLHQQRPADAPDDATRRAIVALPPAFCCPVCLEKDVWRAWKHVLFELRKNFPYMSLVEFGQWVLHNYMGKWAEKERRMRADRVEGTRECRQIDPATDNVKLARFERKPPYPYEPFAPIIDRSFLEGDDSDPMTANADAEAEPGVIYQSVETHWGYTNR